MFQFLRFHRSLAWLNAAIILFVTLFSLAVPMMFKLMIEGVLPDGNRRAFLVGAALLLLVTLGRNLFGVLQDYVFLLHRQRIEVTALQSALQRRDWKQLNLEHTWAMMQNFVASFQYFWIEFAFYVAYAVFISTLVLIGFYWIEPAYFWLSLLFMLFHAINFSLFRPRAARAAQGFNQDKADLMGEVATHLKLLPEMKSMRAEALLHQRLAHYSLNYAKAWQHKELLALWQQTVQDNLVNAFYLLFFLSALYLSAARSVSIGSAALALFLAGFLFEPIYRFSTIIKSLFDARAYTGWISASAGMSPPIAPPIAPPKSLPKSASPAADPANNPAKPVTLHLHQVQTAVMQARAHPPLNLCLQAGSMVLIRGSSGCGKSTLLDCIAGLEPLAAGRIEATDDIYYCEQNAAIFPGDIRQNISFYAEQPVLTTIDALLRTLHLDQLGLQHAPTACSGGQKQRLAVARSLYCGQSILLYDEPSSALDAENEHALLAHLAHVATTRLVILVSHSAAAPAWCGQVIDLN